MNFMAKTNALRLTDMKAGTCARINFIDAGKKAREKLISMGLVPGKEIEVISSSGHGPVVVKVDDTRIALGHGLADKVIIKI
ncbi:MAG: FeoA domain protein [Spirochaetes bacterium ADurb.Bin218]|jgi:ferrous iron transport protein A|nr:MAG: FeoA domain protein [Spirochaetes bacterium ADurb.Bin218]HOV09377.1 FeoA family protein [Spirochaetota bacterium]